MTSYTSNFVLKTVNLSNNWSAQNVAVWWAGDLNGDGKSDLLVPGASFPGGSAGNVGQPGMVLVGDGGGNFSQAPGSLFPTSSLLTVSPRQIVSADFNGDGRPDIFIASHGFDASPFPGEQNRLYLSQANGTYVDATSSLPKLLDFSHSAAVGDVNGDGRPDIYVGNIFGAALISPYVLLNDGSGHFTTSTTIIPNQHGQSLDLVQGFFTSSLLVDLNRDGHPDLVVGSATSGAGQGHSTVYWNTGAGFDDNHRTTLPDGVLPTTNRITLSIASIDINNDGRPDLVALSTANSPFYQGVYLDVFLNKSDGTFSNATSQVIGTAASHPSGGWSAFLEVVDINRDGLPDLVLPNYSGPAGASSDSVFVLLNNGSGRLLPVTLSDLTTSPQLFQYNTDLVQTDSGYSFVNIGANGPTLSARELVALGPLPPVAAGAPTSVLTGPSKNYMVSLTAGSSSVSVQDKVGADGTVVVGGGTQLQFTDQSVDTSWFAKTATLTASQIVNLTELYIASFNRAPDALGLDYWGSQLKDGMSLNAIAASFFTQPEATAAYPAGQPTDTFVNQVYNNVLGRAPDAAGLSYWVGQLQSGNVGKNTFLLAIINGVQGADAQYLANKEAVGAHFALAQGLSDSTWAKTVMFGVNGTASTITTANVQTDSFAATAATVAGTELVVKILGIAS